MGLSDHRLLSPPCRVRFAGWEATTSGLQQAGWQLSAEQDVIRNRIRLAMRFEPCRIYMVSETEDYDFYRVVGIGAGNRGMEYLPTFHVRHVSSQVMVELVDSSFASFRPIDAMPQVITRERKNIEDFNIFATPLARTEEIIVEPETVSSLMEQIRKLQSPELAAIRRRNRNRDLREQPMPQQNFHAQILSIAA